MSLHLLGLHPHMGRHIVLDSSTGQARVTAQVLRVIQVLQGVSGQRIGSLSVLWLPVLGQIEQRALLRLWGMGGQIRLHVVFGEGERRPGDPIGAGAAETRQRRRTGRVFVIVVRTEQLDTVLVMKTFRAKVDAGSSRAATHHAGHGELGMVR